MKCVKINKLAKQLGLTPEEVKASLARLSKEGKVMFTPGKTTTATSEDFKAGVRIAGSTGNVNLNVSRTKSLGQKKTPPVGAQSVEAKIVAGEPVTQITEGAVPTNQKGLADRDLQEIRNNPPVAEAVAPPQAEQAGTQQRSSIAADLGPTTGPVVEGTTDSLTPAGLDNRMNGIFQTENVNDVGSRDTLMTSAVRGKNFVEGLASPEAKVRLKSQGFKNRDITTLEILTNPSFELARKFKGFQEAQQIAMTNMENNELLRNRHKLGADGKLAPIFQLPRKMVEDFDAVVNESDKKQQFFDDATLDKGIDVFDIAGKKTKTIRLNDEQKAAYKDHKRVTDNLLSDTMDVLDFTTMAQFSEKVFAADLKQTVERKTGGRVFRSFGETVTSIIQSDPENMPANVRKLIGDNADETIKNLDEIATVVFAEDQAFNLDEADIPADLSLEERDDFAKSYAKLISRKVSLQVLRRQMGEQAFYNPRQRGDGEFVLIIKNKDDADFNVEKELGVGFKEPENIKFYKRFDTAKERSKEIGELKKTFDPNTVDFISSTQPKVSEFQFQNISDSSLVNFLNRSLEQVKNGGIITQEQLDDIHNSMLGVLAADLNTRGFTRNLKPRRGGDVIHGYELADYKKRMNNHINGNSGFISKQLSGLEYSKLLRNTPRENSVFSPEQTNLYDAVHRFVSDMSRNQGNLDRFSGKLRGFAFVWYLTGQLRTPALNLTQNMTLGIAEGAKHTKFAEFKMTKAMADIARLNINQKIKRRPPGSISKKHQRLLNDAAARGITGAQFTKESTEVAKSQFSQTLGKVISALATPFAITEQTNRQAAFLFGLRVADEKGMNDVDTFNFARQFTADVHFLFGKENQVEAARGGTAGSAVLKTALTFRSFTTNTLFALKRSIGDKEFNSLARYMGMMFVFGGAAGIPFFEFAMTLIERATGVPYRKQIKEEMRSVGGDFLAEFGTAGLPAVAGADISGAIRLGLPTDGSVTEIASETIFGIWGSLLNNIAGAGAEAVRGRGLRAMEKVAPAAIKGFIRAGRESREGVRTFSGKRILDQFGNPIVPTTAENVFRAAGFQPSRLAEIGKERREAANIGRRFTKKRNNLISDFKSALSVEEQRKLVKKIEKFNTSNAVKLGFVKPITRQSTSSTRPATSQAERAFARIGQ